MARVGQAECEKSEKRTSQNAQHSGSRPHQVSLMPNLQARDHIKFHLCQPKKEQRAQAHPVMSEQSVSA